MAEADLKTQWPPHRWLEQARATIPETVSEKSPDPGWTLHMWQSEELQMPWVPNHSRNLPAGEGDGHTHHVGLGGEEKARLS